MFVTLHSQSGNNDSKLNTGAVVQQVRIHACHAWGREFESRPHRKEDANASSFVFVHNQTKATQNGWLLFGISKMN